MNIVFVVIVVNRFIIFMCKNKIPLRLNLFLRGVEIQHFFVKKQNNHSHYVNDSRGFNDIVHSLSMIQ